MKNWNEAWQWFQNQWGYDLDLNLVLTFGGLTKRKIIKMYKDSK